MVHRRGMGALNGRDRTVSASVQLQLQLPDPRFCAISCIVTIWACSRLLRYHRFNPRRIIRSKFYNVVSVVFPPFFFFFLLVPFCFQRTINLLTVSFLVDSGPYTFYFRHGWFVSCFIKSVLILPCSFRIVSVSNVAEFYFHWRSTAIVLFSPKLFPADRFLFRFVTIRNFPRITE